MKHILLISLLLTSSITFSQRIVNVDRDKGNGSLNDAVVNGALLKSDKYVRVVEGSAYFSKEWMKGHLILANGKYSNNNSVRIDLIENTVEYLDKYEQVMISITPITKATLTDTTNGKSFYFVFSSVVPELHKNKIGWYQVLDSGSIGLYKRIAKVIDERKAFNSATYEQTISDLAEYYLFYNKVLHRIKNPNDLSAILEDRKKELDAYINKNNLKGKKDLDYTELLTYYNSLQSK